MFLLIYLDLTLFKLKTKLQSIKTGFQTISKYIQKIKHVANSLARVSYPVDNEDLIWHTLNGLPDYAPFKTAIRTQSSSISIEELHMLIRKEPNVDHIQPAVADFSSKDNDNGNDRAGNNSSGNTFSSRGNGLNMGFLCIWMATKSLIKSK